MFLKLKYISLHILICVLIFIWDFIFLPLKLWFYTSALVKDPYQWKFLVFSFMEYIFCILSLILSEKRTMLLYVSFCYGAVLPLNLMYKIHEYKLIQTCVHVHVWFGLILFKLFFSIRILPQYWNMTKKIIMQNWLSECNTKYSQYWEMCYKHVCLKMTLFHNRNTELQKVNFKTQYTQVQSTSFVLVKSEN